MSLGFACKFEKKTYVDLSRARLSKEAFDVDRGLWAENANHELYPTSTSYSREGKSLAVPSSELLG